MSVQLFKIGRIRIDYFDYSHPSPGRVRQSVLTASVLMEKRPVEASLSRSCRSPARGKSRRDHDRFRRRSRREGTQGRWALACGYRSRGKPSVAYRPLPAPTWSARAASHRLMASAASGSALWTKLMSRAGSFFPDFSGFRPFSWPSPFSPPSPSLRPTRRRASPKAGRPSSPPPPNSERVYPTYDGRPRPAHKRIRNGLPNRTTNSLLIHHFFNQNGCISSAFTYQILRRPYFLRVLRV